MDLKVMKNHPDAKLPEYALEGDAGLDLYSVEDVTLKTHEIKEVRTGLRLELPPKTVGLVWDKSGTSFRGLKVLGGVFDEIYRGELIVHFTNVSEKDYIIEKGDKIAQLLIQPILHPNIVEADKLSETERGKRRLGSTGRK